MLELLKVIVQPVVIERDQDGNILGERTGETVALFTPESLPDYVEALRAGLAEANRKAVEVE